MKLKAAILLGLIAFNSFDLVAQASESTSLTVQANARDSERMLAHSKKTRETLVLKQRIRDQVYPFTYEVFNYDSNWKCYSRRGIPNDVHTFIEKHVYGYEKPDEVFCMFRKGSAPQAVYNASPKPIDLNLNPEQTQQIIANGDLIGDDLVQVSGYFGSKPVRFFKYHYANWNCLSLDPASSLPKGASVPASKCQYRPYSGATLEANSDSVSSGPASR